MVKESLSSLLFKRIIIIITISSCVFYFLTYSKIEKQIDEEESLLYNQSIQTKIFLLEEKYNRLESTGLTESYEQSFKDSILILFKKMFYDKNLEVYPFIIDSKQKTYLLYPKYNEKNEKKFNDNEILQKSIEVKSGEFNLGFKKENKWIIIQNFKQWDWIIGYSIPFDVKYKSLYTFQTNFILMTIFLLLIVSLIVWITIRKSLNPIAQLIIESKKIKDGNLDSNISIKANSELFELSNNFISMRDSVKRNISELDNTKKLLKNIIDNAPVRIFWKNREGKYLGANKLFLEDFGNIQISELIGKSDFDFSVKEASQYIEDDLEVMNKNKSKLNFIEHQTFDTDEEKTLTTSKVPLLDFDGKVMGVLAVYNDITEQIKLENNLKNKEKLLFEQSKLASMGEMIGNIAHQWRQPLSVITMGATGMMVHQEMDKLDEKTILKSCNAINDNAQYLSKTIDDFRNFITGNRTKKLFRLTNNINSFLQLVEGTIKKNDITLVFDLDDKIQINGYENELIQCFINIFNNSKDALKEKVIKNKLVFISTLVENNKAIIKIKDNATGIPENILPKIFEPYFTTKHESQGTGLGLHMVYNLIVDGMDGIIEGNNIDYVYENNNYTGMEFTITLSLS